jgi:hypothetical protein
MSTEAGPSTPSAAPETEKLEQKLADTKLQESEGKTKEEPTPKYARGENPKLRYKKPYWWAYKTFVKQRYATCNGPIGKALTHRWIGRELLEVISTEFRDRSVEYYVSPHKEVSGEC